MAEEERPREKLLLHGRRHLTNAEIMAIIIGKGSTIESAVQLSQRILSKYNNDWNTLDGASVKDLCMFYGVGEAKALSIVSAIELGRRRASAPKKPIKKITSSKDIFTIMYPTFENINHEEFWIMILNTNNSVKNKLMISKGGLSGTVADPKVIFKMALDHHAAALILVHNHPSGNLRPSDEDVKITKKLIGAGLMLDLPVLDHVIITNESYTSMADEGII